MSGYAVGAGAAGAAAAIAQAIKASGALVRIEPEGFRSLLARSKEALVVVASGGFFSKSYRYLMNYRGLYFYTQSPDPLDMPGDAEVVTVKSIWIP